MPWQVAELRQFALRGILVAALFAPFQLAYQLVGNWIGPTLKTSFVARESFYLLGVTLENLSYGVFSMACAKLVVHKRSALHFFAAGAASRLGLILLEPAFVQIVPVLNWNVARLLIVTVHYLLPMWLLIIIFVHLTNRRLSRNSALTLFAAVAFSVFATTFLIQGIALTTAGSQMWGFISAIAIESLMLVILALFLWIGCRMSRGENRHLVG
ncbi:MAG: hypothetical protein WKF77_31660 [Planctomycetaceae bacterium]